MDSKSKEMRSQAMGKLKQDLAEEMGFGELVRTQGWGELAAKDCGRIGGRMGSRLSRNILRKLAAMEEAEKQDHSAQKPDPDS
ncbi:MAG: small, acid-soluble spore protein, alpha/beta type [Firmicutes bacterium]|nr:small, acid-soluble spore protein, alpha/beta type [Bacillota bacterium]